MKGMQRCPARAVSMRLPAASVQITGVRQRTSPTPSARTPMTVASVSKAAPGRGASRSAISIAPMTASSAAWLRRSSSTASETSFSSVSTSISACAGAVAHPHSSVTINSRLISFCFIMPHPFAVQMWCRSGAQPAPLPASSTSDYTLSRPALSTETLPQSLTLIGRDAIIVIRK